jgi:hypothetical protein
MAVWLWARLLSGGGRLWLRGRGAHTRLADARRERPCGRQLRQPQTAARFLTPPSPQPSSPLRSLPSRAGRQSRFGPVNHLRRAPTDLPRPAKRDRLTEGAGAFLWRDLAARFDRRNSDISKPALARDSGKDSSQGFESSPPAPPRTPHAKATTWRPSAPSRARSPFPHPQVSCDREDRT